MGIRDFIAEVQELFGLPEGEKQGKKKSLKVLIEQLEESKSQLNEKIRAAEPKSPEREELKEQKKILKLQIKKAKKHLQEL